MSPREKINKKIQEYGIKRLEGSSNLSEHSFAYTPNISNQYVNKKKREEHRRSMSLGAR